MAATAFVERVVSTAALRFVFADAVLPFARPRRSGPWRHVASNSGESWGVMAAAHRKASRASASADPSSPELSRQVMRVQASSDLQGCRRAFGRTVWRTWPGTCARGRRWCASELRPRYRAAIAQAPKSGWIPDCLGMTGQERATGSLRWQCTSNAWRMTRCLHDRPASRCGVPVAPFRIRSHLLHFSARVRRFRFPRSFHRICFTALAPALLRVRFCFPVPHPLFPFLVTYTSRAFG